MIQVPLTGALGVGRFALIDDCDEWLLRFIWNLHASGYVRTHVPSTTSKSGRTTRKIHQFILPDADMIDHINRDKLDNRRSNLRPTDYFQNNGNFPAHRDGQSAHRGVHRHGQTGRWTAQIRFRGQTFYLGCFDTEDEAALAYNAKRLALETDFEKVRNK